MARKTVEVEVLKQTSQVAYYKEVAAKGYKDAAVAALDKVGYYA